MNSFIQLEPLGRRRFNRVFLVVLHLLLLAFVVGAVSAGTPLS